MLIFRFMDTHDSKLFIFWYDDDDDDELLLWYG